MLRTAAEIKSKVVKPGSLGVFFMGQAGFVLKDSKGTTVAIDLYLSDCCERFFGFKRLMPKLILPGEVDFDIVVATHGHYDHLDIDAIPFLMANPNTKLYAAYDAIEECEKLSIRKEQISPLSVGKSYEQDGIYIEAVECDHGELAKDAVGLIIKAEGKCIYIAGDTCYRSDYAEKIAKHKIDLMIAPINGAFGNLDEKECVLTAQIIKPGMVIPCHYWNFAEHGGNPDLFIKNIKEMMPEQKYALMTPGEGIVI